MSPVNTRWSVRTPPVASATSFREGGAPAIVFDVHSFGKKRSTTARASASSSVLNDEATHENRLSQLHPPLIQTFFSCSSTANKAADEPARTSMTENIAENRLDRQTLEAGRSRKSWGRRYRLGRTADFGDF